MTRMRTNGVTDISNAGRKVSRVRRRMMVMDVESPRTVKPGSRMTGSCWAKDAEAVSASAGMARIERRANLAITGLSEWVIDPPRLHATVSQRLHPTRIVNQAG